MNRSNSSSYIDNSNNRVKEDDTYVLWGLTVLWVFVIILLPALLYYVNGRSFNFKGLSLNELGDYLAGVAAPLAFFWLVYGYYQQGKQLKINNETLILQYDELQQSVTAQKDQAQSMREQLHLVIREKFYPKFELNNFEYLEEEEFIDIKLKNKTNSIFSVDVKISSDNMLLIDSVNYSENILNFSIQTMQDIQSSFTILFRINFVLETGDSAAQCYLIEYSALRHNDLTMPNLEMTNCKDNM